MTKWNLLARSLCVGVAGVLSLPAAANIINPGFELGTGADADNWNEIEVAGGTMGASAIADRDTAMPLTGDHAMLLRVDGAPDFGPVAEIQQQTIVGSVVPGSTYDFEFFTKGTPGPGSVNFYEVVWFDGDGSAGGGPQGSATGLQSFSNGPTYTPITATGLVAPATADSALIQIRLVTGAFDGAAGETFIDDVSLEVPEPASLALLSLGGLALLRRKAH